MPKNWCLQTVVLEKPLELPWTARKSNQPILREIKPEYSLEGLSWSSTILVIWCKQMTHWKSPWCWELLRAEGEEGIRGRDGWTASPMQWTWTWANSGRQWGTGRPGVLQYTAPCRHRHDWANEQWQLSTVPNTIVSLDSVNEWMNEWRKDTVLWEHVKRRLHSSEMTPGGRDM